MQASAGYYRYPTVYRDRIVFVSEDDLWEVSRTGGMARRLTVGLAEASRPQYSPDGRWIAFTGRETGDQEVYVMASEGGPVRRLTYLGATTTVVGWTPDGNAIIFASNARQPFRNWMELATVTLSGDRPQPMPYGRANSIAFGPRHGIVLGRNTGDPARWKRYRGGTRGYLWIDPAGDGSFTRFEGLEGNLANPMWIGDRIYFVSDAEGVGNLYSMTPEGKDVRRLTHHQTYYLRNASTDGRHIVYHLGADLYCFAPETERETQVAVEYLSPFTQRERLYPDFSKFWTEYQPDPAHKERLLLTGRGKLFALNAFDGPVLPVGTTQGVRYRLAKWLPDGEHLIVISDEGGEEGLERIAVRTSERRRLNVDLGRAIRTAVSGDGKWAAVANHRMELWLIDVEAWSAERIDQSAYGPLMGFDFSPDHRWLAYSLLEGPRQSAIYLYAIPSGVRHPVTVGVLADFNPVFDPDGKYLYFLSYRVFNPVYDNLRFDLGFPKGIRPYLIPLAKTTPSPFIDPSSVTSHGPKDEAEEGSEEAAGHGGDDAEQRQAESSPTAMVVDVEDISQRVLAIPVAEGRYQQIAALPGGRVLYTVVEPEGSLDQSFFSESQTARATLKMYDLKAQKEEVLAHPVTSFVVAPDHTAVLLRDGRTLRITKAGEKTDDKKREPGRESGIVNLGRVVLSVDRLAEWTQMQRDAWRLMRENFWSEDMSQVDWEGVYDRYQALLPRIGTRSEFSDLIWEMQGELGTSHAYEMGGDYRPEPTHRLGHLAMDAVYDLEHNGYRLTHIARGDSWREGHDSPLNAPGVTLQPGDVIHAVNGQPVGPDLPPSARLIKLAEQPVALRVLRRGQENPVDVVVKTLAQTFDVYYRQWVNKNRQYVWQQTQGRVGYVHIPDMGPRGYAEFFRAYLTENTRDGLIVDVRFNGGGHVSQLILEHLARRHLGYDIPRHGRPISYPEDAVLGPVVALTNEHAGSDGDIFSHAFKMMKIGPLLGTRTWGGVIGINPRLSLVDGSMVTQPEFAFWFNDVGFNVENYGTDPDIWVDNTPQDALAGRDDAQLERAVEEALRLLEATQPEVPDFGPRPSKRPPALT